MRFDYCKGTNEKNADPYNPQLRFYVEGEVSLTVRGARASRIHTYLFGAPIGPERDLRALECWRNLQLDPEWGPDRIELPPLPNPFPESEMGRKLRELETRGRKADALP